MIAFFRSLRHFLHNETGSASIEFCILFPSFMLAMLSSIEAGLMMTRNVMLERGLRDLFGRNDPGDHRIQEVGSSSPPP
ncbi:TadE/TadG family type IV pilus assembly protein [Ovoidimarina sediminis]|uniref:TadE/TadG family type IV pilus assembly protein n=1 Tax=Ovoidimarina sediminis TaxID=3079856 RepID=UPI003977B40B